MKEFLEELDRKFGDKKFTLLLKNKKFMSISLQN